MTAPPASSPDLTSLWRDLPREGRLLLSIVVLEFLGTGLVLPFQVVYLHEVRRIALSDVGLLLALSALAGFLAAGPAGTVIDRLGARVVLISSLCLLMAGNLVLMLAESVPVADIALTLSGAAFGGSLPSAQSLVAAVVPPQLRQRYFGVNFTLLNLGIGLGGMLGGAFIDVDRLGTFQAIYVLDSLSYLPALYLLLGPMRHVAGRPERHDMRAEPAASYFSVLRRPAVIPLMLLSFSAPFVGYGQLNAGMPAFARAVGRVSTQGPGFAFAANTLVIVLLQLVGLQRIEGRRRTRVIAVMGVVWALAWLLLGASGVVPGTLGATILVAASASVFALGETLLQPTIPALVNDLAPDHLCARYNALNGAAFQLASIIAPTAAGFLVGRHLGGGRVGTLVAGALMLALFAITRVEQELPASVIGAHGAHGVNGVNGVHAAVGEDAVLAAAGVEPPAAVGACGS